VGSLVCCSTLSQLFSYPALSAWPPAWPASTASQSYTVLPVQLHPVPVGLGPGTAYRGDA
jgi:hypothetical protein